MATIKTLIGNLKSSTYDVYSTNETVVGTWIDGKPIYRKVVILSSDQGITNTGTTISHGIHYIDCPISCRAIGRRATTDLFWSTDIFWSNEKNSTSGSFYCAVRFERNTFIFEYIKTTH